MSTDITHIPLNKLSAWEGNVRKTQNKGSIDELAANIDAIGLKQNLVVGKDGKNHVVIAGCRRLAALQKNAKAGKIKADFPVPCQIAPDDANWHDISLAENTVRENMHAADECDAFTELSENGMPDEDIAARFGKTVRYVQQRKRLARGVSPKLMKAYRAGELTLQQLEAFTVSEDFEAQEKVFEAFDPDYDDIDWIKGELTTDDIAATHPLVKYVGLEVYEIENKGPVKRDLFGNEKDVYITDFDLLKRLGQEKLDRAAKPIEKEGFKRLIVQVIPDRGANSRLHRIYPHKGKWTKEQKSYASVIITVGQNGKTEIDRGVVLPEDMPKQKPKKSKAKTGAAAGDLDGEGEPPQEQSSDLSAALVQNLTEIRTAALGVELTNRPDIALVSVVHAYAEDVFLGGRGISCVQVRASQQFLPGAKDTKAHQMKEAAKEVWGEKLPGTPEALWEWCLVQPLNVLLALLALCVGPTVNAVRSKNDKLASVRFAHAGLLAKALELDMKDYFEPNAENYFTKVGKPQIIEALQDVDGTLPSATMKKSDMAKMAAQAVAGKGWLPKLLR